MKLTQTAIPDVVLIEPTVFTDERGYFMETFRKDIFEKYIGYQIGFVQDNESKSNRGVLRGLHYQLGQAAQSKLVRVIKGKVLDVAVDIRKASPTFGQHVAIELSGENKHQMFIPKGFAHGFLVLEDDTIFSYKVDNYYSPKDDRGIAFDDETLLIDWQLSNTELVISGKDQMQPLLASAEVFE